MGNDYRGGSPAVELQSVTEAQDAELEFERIQAMDFANRENSLLKRSSATQRKSVRFSASLKSSRSNAPVRNDIPTSTNTEKDNSNLKYSTPEPKDRRQHEELLMPVTYSPPSESESGSDHSTLSDDSWNSVKHNVERIEAHYALPESDVDSISKPADLTIDTEHRGHKRNTSSMSRRSRRDSHQFEIYFTPTDYTRSQIFLSSPVGSPELPQEQADDECSTPKASMSRPPSAIFVGSVLTPSANAQVRKEKLNIAPTQLDQLVKALAKSQLIQKHVRQHWWDTADIPDDESILGSDSPPALASISTIYSQPNANIEDDSGEHPHSHPYAKRPLPAPPVPFGGIALLDPKMHGSPARYTSKDYRQGSKVLSVGSNTFLGLPYGTDVECTLRIEPASTHNSNCKVMLQAVNQAVDRKTSKRAHLLVADVDVTDLFAKAALTELAEATGKAFDDIIVQSSTAIIPDESSIDWCALADEMQDTADTALIIDNAVQNFARLDSETCAMRTLALMSELERIKDQHMEFLIVVPTSFHSKGMPSNMRIPWVSQRLYTDWYGAKDGPGFTQTAKDFQKSVVAHVAKNTVAKEKFTVGIPWKEEAQVVHCVPLMDRAQGEGAAWACFIRGEFDLQL